MATCPKGYLLDDSITRYKPGNKTRWATGHRATALFAFD